jgi:hypothetical protein
MEVIPDHVGKGKCRGVGAASEKGKYSSYNSAVAVSVHATAMCARVRSVLLFTRAH